MGCTRKPIRVSIRVSERVSKRVSKDSIRVSTMVLEGFRLGFHAMTSYKKELIHTVRGYICVSRRTHPSPEYHRPGLIESTD